MNEPFHDPRVWYLQGEWGNDPDYVPRLGRGSASCRGPCVMQAVTRMLSRNPTETGYCPERISVYVRSIAIFLNDNLKDQDRDAVLLRRIKAIAIATTGNAEVELERAKIHSAFAGSGGYVGTPMPELGRFEIAPPKIARAIECLDAMLELNNKPKPHEAYGPASPNRAEKGSQKMKKGIVVAAVVAAGTSAALAQGGMIEPTAHVDIPEIQHPQTHTVMTPVVVPEGELLPIDQTAEMKAEWRESGWFSAGSEGAVLVGEDGFFLEVNPGDIVQIIPLGYPAAFSVDEATGGTTLTNSCSLDSCGRNERFCAYCNGAIAFCRCVNGTQDQTQCTTLGGSNGDGGSISCKGSSVAELQQ